MRARAFLCNLSLRALPAPLRREHGADITDLYLERQRQARRRGRAAAARYSLLAFVDLLGSAARTRFRRREAPAHLARLNDSPLSSWTPEMLLRDLNFGIRTLLHRPGFTAVVLITLGLGIGANAIIYSAIDNIVLNPFDFPEPDRTVAIGVEYPRLGQPLGFFEVISPPEYNDILEQTTAFERTAAFDIGNRQITGGDIPQNLRTGFWWGDPLRVLGMSPVHGRFFSADEIRQQAPLALVSNRVFESRFAGDPAIVGQTIQINGVDHTLLGVFPTPAVVYGIDLWTPMWAQPEDFTRTRRQMNVVARLGDDVTLTQANAELEAVARRTELEYGDQHDEYVGWRLETMTWTDANVRTLKPTAFVLMGTVSFVLLLVCANVASLLLSRSSSRRREIAVRAALGAGRARIVRQLLSESLLMAVLGGAVGLALAWVGLQWLVANTPAPLLPTTRPIGLNLRALYYTGFVSVLAGVLFGIVPALQSARFDLHGTLTESGRSTGGRSRRRLHGVFVAVEVALALMLLTGAGMFIHSFARLQRVDPGMDVDNVLTMRLTLPWEKFEGEAIANFFVDLADRVENIPGVRSAASGSQFAPIGFIRQRFAIDGQAVADESELPNALLTIATADYFETLGIPLRTGRFFDSGDLPGTQTVTVINQTLATRTFGDEPAVGKRIKLGAPDDEERPWLTVVGVVGDTKNNGLAAPVQPELFVGLRQVNGVFNQLYLLVRTEAEPRALLPQIRQAVADLDPEQPIYGIRTVDEAFAQGFAMEGFALRMLTAFSVLALVLAAVGISGVVAFAVSERSREIGVRMALGAVGSEVRRLVVRQALLPVAIGAVIGLGLSMALGQALSSILFEVGMGDPTTMLGVAIVLGLVAAAAGYLPARRASRIDPVAALRAE